MRSRLQRLLAPAVALMNRLSYPRKFALISLLFVLPLALVMYILLSEIDDRIAFAGKETQGIRYLLPVRTLLQHVIGHLRGFKLGHERHPHST